MNGPGNVVKLSIISVCVCPPPACVGDLCRLAPTSPCLLCISIPAHLPGLPIKELTLFTSLPCLTLGSMTHLWDSSPNDIHTFPPLFSSFTLSFILFFVYYLLQQPHVGSPFTTYGNGLLFVAGLRPLISSYTSCLPFYPPSMGASCSF